MKGTPVLAAEGLKKYYPVKNTALLRRTKQFVHAVDGVDFTIGKGETLGLVGESGCGKSTVGRLITGIEAPDEGRVFFRGQDISGMNREQTAGIRTKLQMIFQDPYGSLNPKKRVRDILSDPLLMHGLADSRSVDAVTDSLLEEVGLPSYAKYKYPHEFSGGQRQRIVIARALSLQPDLIVCDEPISALDNSIQAQILNLLRQLQKDRGVSYLFIAHGLGTVRYVSTNVAVMYLGKIVERAGSEEIFASPLHPYSRMLISAAPIPDPTIRDRKVLIPVGEVPSAVHIPEGCRFSERCPFATQQCRQQEPELSLAAGSATHEVACWHAGKGGEHVQIHS